MMEEVSGGEHEVTQQFDAANIADELQEAAQTDVTQASMLPEREVSPPKTSAASIGMPSPSPLPPQFASHSLPPPPTSGFVPLPAGTVAHVNPHEVYTSLAGLSQSGQPMQPIQSFVPTAPTTEYQTQLQMPFEPASQPNLPLPSVDQRIHFEHQTPADEESSKDNLAGEGGGGLFGWFSSSSFMNKVVEKTKSSVETVITTLDPQMKQVIYSGEQLDIVVTSTKSVKVDAVRDGFLEVFGRAAVQGMESQPGVASQPVGCTAGVKGAEERIDNLRQSGQVHERQALVSVESFIMEMMPDRWYDLACVLLKDPAHNIELQTFSMATPIPTEFVMEAQDRTPTDYPLRWSGLSVTCGEVIQTHMPGVSHSDWHRALAGVSRQQMIQQAAKVLAFMYQERLKQYSQAKLTQSSF